ncbi:hypothetical protein [Acidithiobacillus ferriphilus]|uniref:hypothetical protein n=1 Tax=Acidithiobacillus ferriphilus TaxID=1689834 RepID=UPI001C071C24|nr:hypothetical protein [Acidithiobacillus ferriphilus]MBU2829096.1 hypothetical protein [Acidithiobacillus ferriphilus]
MAIRRVVMGVDRMFRLDGCALVILPAQIALCASAPAGAGCQGMADLSAAEAGGRGGQ